MYDIITTGADKMNNKERYIRYANKNFKGKARKLVINQIELFYDSSNISKNHYNVGDEVYLKKGTFLHGLGLNPNAFDFIVDNGFIASDFNENGNKKKIFNSIGMWNIKEDCYLKDYIKLYSGATFTYNIGRGTLATKKYEVVPFGKVEEYAINLNNRDEVWSWSAEQTKEIRFMPSLSSNKVQIGFILNTENEYAKKLIYADFFNKDFGKNILKYFCIKDFLNWFLSHPITPITTDRESSIMFGLPSILIEGIIVGREYENDNNKIRYIKEKLPDCYICNLDGKVIIGNK